MKTQSKNSLRNTKLNLVILAVLAVGMSASILSTSHYSEAAGVVSGNVYNDLDNNGADAGAGEPGFRDVGVRIWNDTGNNNVIDVGTDTIASGVITNSSGNYTFPSLADGNYLVEVYDPTNQLGAGAFTDSGTDGILDTTIAGGAVSGQSIGFHKSTASSNGTFSSTVKIDENTTNGPGSANLDANDNYGSSIANIGDLNNDGVQDFAVGARSDEGTDASSGAINIHFMNTDGTIDSTVRIDENTANGPGAASLENSDAFGWSIANLGDLNNDGVQDLVVGARNDEGTDLGSGAIYILYLNTDGTIDSTVKIDENTTNGAGAASLDVGDTYGSAVANVGDLNNDGVQDIAVGAPLDEGTDADSGAIYIHYMNTNGTIDSTVKIDENTTNGPGASSLDAGDFYGLSLASIGDLDGDGVQDIAVGANHDEGTDADSGAFYIHYMNTNGTIDSTVKIDENTTNGATAASLQASDFYGGSVADVGDVNNDGVRDIAVGATADEGTDSASGAIYIHLMNANGSIDSTVKVDENTSNGPGAASLNASDFYGGALANIGDLNDDGVQDLAVGAYQDEGTDLGSGAIYIHYLTAGNTVSGTVYTDEGSTTIADGTQVELLIGGVSFGTTTTTSGVYSFSGLTLAAASLVTVYIDNGSDFGATVMRASGAVAHTGTNVYKDHLIVRHEDAGPITSANLDTSNPGTDANLTSVYNDGVPLSVDAGRELYVWTGDTFTPGGTMDLNGSIEIVATATLNAAANAITIAGDFVNSGTFTHTAGTDMTFDGTTQTFTPGATAIGSDIIISGSSTTTLGSTLNIFPNDLTVAGTLAANSRTLTIDVVSNTGTIQVNGSNTISITTQDIDSGTWEYVGNGTGAATNHTIQDFGTTDYFNLTINDTSATNSDTFRPGGALNIAGAMTVTDGAFSGLAQFVDVDGAVSIGAAGAFTNTSQTTTIGGDFTNAGTFTATSGIVTLDGGNQTITPTAATSFPTLRKFESTNDSTDSILTLAGNISISTQLNIDGLDTNDRLNIVSSVPTTARTITFTGSSTFLGDFLDITDSTVVDTSTGITPPINPGNSINGGNTTNWFPGVGFTIYQSLLTTTLAEGGRTDSFTVVLDTQPSSNVVLDVSSNDTSSATVSAATLTFTTSNWNRPQVITVTAPDDADVVSETPTITVAVNDGSSDNNFDPLADQTLNVTIYDTDATSYISDGANAANVLGQNTGASISDPQPDYLLELDDQANRLGLSTPADGAMDTVNHRYFQTDKDSGRILVFNLNVDNTFPDHIPDNVLGKSDFVTEDDFAASATNIADPLGLAFDSTNNRLFVAENGDNRVVVYDTATITNGEGAVYIIGQTNFSNVSCATTQTRMCTPNGLVYDDARSLLFVTQDGSNRVAVYDVRAEGSADQTLCGTTTNGIANGGMNASCVLGQTSFTTSTAAVTQGGMTDPQDVAYDSTTGRLFVSQGTPNRVTVYDVRPEGSGAQALCGETPTTGIANGQLAACYLGQTSFTNGTFATSISRMRSPRGIDFFSDKLYVAENGNNRVTVWDVTSITNGEDAINVLGQADFDTIAAASLTTSSIISPWFASVDSSNSRLFVGQANGAFRVSVFDIGTILDNEDAIDVLGQYDGVSITDPQPIYTKGDYNGVPSRYGMSAPADVEVDTVNHRLFATDNDYNRVLVYNLNTNNTLIDRIPDFVLGQSNFYTFALGTTSTTFNGPSHLAYDSARDFLFVSDGTNDRVLVFDTASITNGEAAINVLGQEDFSGATNVQDIDGLNFPAGLAYDTTRKYLYVGQWTGRRVSVFDVDVITDGEDAIKVLGQETFDANVSATTADGLKNAWEVAYDNAGQRLFVTDYTSNRVVQYNLTTIDNGEDAEHVLGQTLFTTFAAATTQAGMDTPDIMTYDPVSKRLFVGSDTSTKSRITVYDVKAITDGEPAVNVLGVGNFTSNTTGCTTTTQSSLCSPGGLGYDTSTNTLYAGDGGNNRVVAFNAGTPDFAVTESAGTTAVTEGGATDTFDVVLTAQPTTDVVLNVSSNDTSSATVSAATLTFTNSNWSTPQTITITAPEDPDTVSETPTITVSVNDASSDDAWDSASNQVVNVTVTDNDTAGFTIAPAGDLALTEGATNATAYTVVLNTQPTTDVVIDISESSAAVTLNTTSLTFTNSNWDTPQNVSISGTQDANFVSEADQLVTFAINDGSSDDSFDAVANQTRNVDITDDDVAGFTIAPAGDVSLAEGATNTALYTVVLNAQPATNVVIDISESSSAVTLNTTSLTFTNSNWSTPQNISVTGTEDANLVSEQDQTLAFAVNDASSDDEFDAVADQTRNIDITDNEVAGFTITPASDVSLTEGATNTTAYAVVLNVQPTSDVVIDISEFSAALSLNTTSLTFTNGNWNVAQDVSISAPEDANLVSEQNQAVTFAVNDGASDDGYDAVADQTRNIDVSDNDVAGFTITPAGDVSLTEGTTTTSAYTVVLNAQPATNVVIDISESSSAVTLNTTSLTFTNSNWNTPHAVSITGTEDANFVSEANQVLTFAVNDAASNDAFDSVADQSRQVDITENDVAGTTRIYLTNTALTTWTVPTDWNNSNNSIEAIGGGAGALWRSDSPAAGGVTYGGGGAAYAKSTNVVLTPGAVIPIHVGSGGEGGDQDATQPEIDAMMGRDSCFDGTVPSDPYTGSLVGVCTVGAKGGGTSGITGLNANNPFSPGRGFASQSAGATRYDGGEGGLYGSAYGTPPGGGGAGGGGAGGPNGNGGKGGRGNWEQYAGGGGGGGGGGGADGSDPETSTGVGGAGGNNFAATAGGAGGFASTAGVAGASGGGGGGGGGQDSGANSTGIIPGTGGTGTEWDSTHGSGGGGGGAGGYDTGAGGAANGGQGGLYGAGGGTGGYSTTDTAAGRDGGAGAQGIIVITYAPIGFTITESGGTTTVTEGGATDSFTVVLTAQPTTDVVFNISSNDTTSATVSSATLTFTNGNWDTPQTITVTAPQDADLISETPVITVSINDAASDDAWDAIADQTVNVSVTDNDSAGFTISPAGDLALTEGATNATAYNVVLNAQPATNVVIDISESSAAVTLNTTSLTFTNSNWDTPQNISISGTEDANFVSEADQVVTFAINDAGSDDPFDAVANQTRNVDITDNDLAGFTISPAGDLTLTEGVTNATAYTVVLHAQPTTDVVIDISESSSAVTLNTTSLTFTNSNWDTPQNVSISGTEDANLVSEQNQVVTFAINDAGSDDTFDAVANQTRNVDITDNDTAGFTITPAGDVSLTEGATNSSAYTVVLNAQPGTDVVIDISESSAAVTLNTTSLTFTNGNWDTPQNVSLTGAEDANLISEQNQLLTFAINDASSDDAFDGVANQTRNVDITDNDAAGFTVSPAGDLALTEGATNATSYTVVLNAQPATDVVIDISESSAAVTLNTTTLTFTNSNWSVAQNVSITGTEDANLISEQNQLLTFAVNDAGSDDAFDAVANQTRNVDITDNDSPGFTVTPAGDLALAEGATNTAGYTVVLNVQPSTDVVIDISESSTAVTLNTASLTFTNSNWDTPQNISLTGTEDTNLISEQNQLLTFAINDAGSDNDFDAVANQTRNVDITDNDTADIVVTPTGITIANENLGTNTFTVVLGDQPTGGNVVIDLTSTATGEATVSPSQLTFTSSDWNTPQTVTVTAVNDNTIPDGTATIIVDVNNTLTTDNTFDSVAAADVSVTITNDDVAGFTITPSGDIALTEGGTNATAYSIVLTAQPTTDVVIDISESSAALTLNTTSLTFTSGNWNIAQSISITGTEDGNLLSEANQIVTLAVNDAGSDDAFDAVSNQTRQVDITDNDAAGFSIVQSGGTTAVTEGGSTDSFTVVLTAQPATDVVFDISSNDTTSATVSSAALTFTNSTWDTPQTITVTAPQDADVVSETPVVTIAINDAASDNTWDLLADQTVNVAVTDNDTAGFTVTQSGGTTAVTEGGATDSFTVVLTAQPATDVVFDIVSNDTTSATVSSATLTFTNGNWDTPQPITVTAPQDPDFASETPVITVSVNDTGSDNAWDPLADQTVNVAVTDNDTPNFTVVQSGGTTTVTEGGATDSFTVVLTAQPTNDVVFSISSNVTTSATVDQATLTFTNSTWDTPQTVVVSAPEDANVVSENPIITIGVLDTSSDDAWDPAPDQTVNVAVTDNDTASFTVVQSGGQTDVTEGGITDSFTVVLNTQPTTNVVFDISSNDTTSATVSAATLTFSNGNWNVPQTITVTAPDDNDAVSETPIVTVAVNDATSDDSYDPLADGSVNIFVTDNDLASFTIIQSGGTTAVTEGGATDSFDVVLTAQPVGNVVIDVASSDITSATVSSAQLTFTNINWSTPQTITVTAPEDVDIVWESPIITLSINDAGSDNLWDPLADQTVNVVITDNDPGSFTVTQTGGTTQITEGSITDTFDVVLTQQPGSNVVFNIISDFPSSASPSATTLTFTNGNWNVPQTITMTAPEDLNSTHEAATITITVDDSSSDSAFDVLADQLISVVVTDNDPVESGGSSFFSPGGIGQLFNMNSTGSSGGTSSSQDALFMGNENLNQNTSGGESAINDSKHIDAIYDIPTETDTLHGVGSTQTGSGSSSAIATDAGRGLRDRFQEAGDYLGSIEFLCYRDRNTVAASLLRSHKPTDDVTRGELISMLIHCLKYDKGVGSTRQFVDVPSNNPYALDILMARAIGIIHGYSDGTFKPLQPITREEAIKVVLLSRFENVEIVNVMLDILDVVQDQWYARYVLFAISRGFADAYYNDEDIMFGVGVFVQREEAARMILRILDI